MVEMLPHYLPHLAEKLPPTWRISWPDKHVPPPLSARSQPTSAALELSWRRVGCERGAGEEIEESLCPLTDEELGL